MAGKAKNGGGEGGEEWTVCPGYTIALGASGEKVSLVTNGAMRE